VKASDAALAYVRRGWCLFPCDAKKRPITPHGFRDASSDPAVIRDWWRRSPDALIGFWPGASDIAVLDIDVKNGVDGLATFVRLTGSSTLPATPTVRTPSWGWHLHYQMPQPRIGITAGAAGRGIGRGLDWRGDTGFAILPTLGSNYRWGQFHFGNTTPLPVSSSLMPKAAEHRPFAQEPANLNQHALAGALRFLMTVREGERNASLFWTACRFAEAIADGLIDIDGARSLLLRAGAGLGLTEPETMATINSAFAERGHG
jgi:hypothetical protein